MDVISTLVMHNGTLCAISILILVFILFIANIILSILFY